MPDTAADLESPSLLGPFSHLDARELHAQRILE